MLVDVVGSATTDAPGADCPAVDVAVTGRLKTVAVGVACPAVLCPAVA